MSFTTNCGLPLIAPSTGLASSTVSTVGTRAGGLARTESILPNSTCSISIQEQQRVKPLVLCRNRHLALHCQTAQERRNLRLRRNQIFTPLHLMKPHLPPHPIAIRPLGAD